MKIILNEDVKYLGEEGDVKTVANGYARNYLFPRNLALPYNNVTLAYFESRKEEIEAKKAKKRLDSASLQEKLTAHTVEIVMPAGVNGKLYGAVTAQTVASALAKDGFEIERKRIDIPGSTIKSVGSYTVVIRLYEATTAELSLSVVAQQDEAAKSTKSKSEATKSQNEVEKTSVTEEVSEKEQAETVAETSEE